VKCLFSTFECHLLSVVGCLQRDEMGRLQLKRNAFAVCVVHRSINAALIDYKKRMCDPSKEFVNYNKTYIVHKH
jgi:hypothetical protein